MWYNENGRGNYIGYPYDFFLGLKNQNKLIYKEIYGGVMKKIIVLLAVLTLLSGCKENENTQKDMIYDNNKKVTNDKEYTEDEAKLFLGDMATYGQLTNNVYVNEYLGFSFEITDDMSFEYSPTYSASASQDVLDSQFSYDSLAIINVYYGEDTKTKFKDQLALMFIKVDDDLISEEAFYDYVNDRNQYSEPEYIDVDGLELITFSKRALLHDKVQFVLVKCGNYWLQFGFGLNEKYENKLFEQIIGTMKFSNKN